ncbi:MAG: thiamine phosphate synthase [Candidatus Omnitrophota bacterium]
MISRKRRLKNCRLYLVLSAPKRKRPLKNAEKRLLRVAKEAIRGGVDILQLRLKDASDRQILTLGKKIRQLTSKAGILFIINDRADLVNVLKADGVHIGQEDLPVKYIRPLIGKQKIVGISTHSLKQAKAATKQGADYISIGPIFATPTKPEYKPVGLKVLKAVSKAVDIPFFAIGDIGPHSVDPAIGSGAEKIAVVRAITEAEDVCKSTAFIKNRIDRA